MNIVADLITDRIARIDSLAPYSYFVHEGTAPHIIRARQGKALRFEIDGTVFYRRSVNHPGTEAQPFMEAGFQPASYAMIDAVFNDMEDYLRARGFN